MIFIDARFGGADFKYEDYPCCWYQRKGNFLFFTVVALLLLVTEAIMRGLIWFLYY
jgi:hypothetical protein